MMWADSMRSISSLAWFGSDQKGQKEGTPIPSNTTCLVEENKDQVKAREQGAIHL